MPKVQSVFSRAKMQEDIVRRIGESVAGHFKDFPHMVIMGPAGLTSSWSLCFFKYPNLSPANKYGKGNCRAVTIRNIDPDTKTFEVTDYSKDTHEYKPGTLGQLNGLNHPGVKFYPGDSLDDLVKLFD